MHSFTVKPGAKVRLKDFDPEDRPASLTKEKARAAIEKNDELLADLTFRLYAENKRSVLLVLQGIDAAGKDGTIRTVTRGVNPQCCNVVSFKAPNSEELSHDFLWRIHKAMPPRGFTTVFNRSHYEDVLVVRVHKLVPEKIWRKRFDAINCFEELAVESGTTIVKCFLNISKEEQRRRLQERLDDPKRRWKFNPGDLEERKLWDDYQKAYEEALTRCNTAHAPWHIIPADRNWVRNHAISNLLVSTFKKLDPKFPPAHPDLDGLVVK